MSAARRLLARLSSRTLLLTTASFVAIFMMASTMLLQSKTYYHPLDIGQIPQIPSQIEAGDRRFAVIVPADGPNHDLCKLITTAIALGYPSPIIVNWGKDFHKTEDDYGSSHLGKITGTLDYLEAVTRTHALEGDKLHDDDLVLVVDAYDLWFQLPPEILLQRFHRQNHQANLRLARQWGGLPEHLPVQQSIIISAQKRCYPTPKESASDLHCDALPESTLRSDLYGAGTDSRPWFNKKQRYHNFRPRYVNSGSIMGPAGDMRRYFRRVKEKMERSLATGSNLPSDQGVFGEVLGEQEIWRTWRRENDNSSSSEEALGLMRQDFEFHVGLDYEQNLFAPTVYAEQDGDFVILGDQRNLDEHSRRLGIWPTRVKGVPADLIDVRSPLDDLFQDDTPRGWKDASVYADFFTAAVPAVLHHNAWVDGAKTRRIEWWDRTWFFPYLRELLELRLSGKDEHKPLARLPTHDGVLSYWAPSSEMPTRNPRLFKEDVITGEAGFYDTDLATLCHAPDETQSSESRWYDEIFRDGQGPLQGNGALLVISH